MCDGNVYFAWSRFTASNSNIYFVRSTDHGVTFSKPGAHHVEHEERAGSRRSRSPETATCTSRGIRESTQGGQPEGVGVAKSTDCGATFSPGKLLVAYNGYEVSDVPAPTAMTQPQAQHDDAMSADREASGSTARDCGDFADACASGYTFFRQSTSTRTTADQKDAAHEWLYLTYAAINGPGRPDGHDLRERRRRAGRSDAGLLPAATTARAVRSIWRRSSSTRRRGRPAVLRRRDPGRRAPLRMVGQPK